jgi:hypothetical protein
VNGLAIPRSSTIGSETRTTKFPFPGFSFLISTVAFDFTAVSIFVARDLNAPHCLQASMVTIRPPEDPALVEDTKVAAESLFDTALTLLFTAFAFLAGVAFVSLV